MEKIKVFESFAGVGAQHKALTNLKERGLVDFEIVGISEWSIYSIISYALIHYNKEFLKGLEDLEETLRNIENSKHFLIEELKDFNFSANTKDLSNLRNIQLKVIKRLYIANKLVKNKGSILDVQKLENSIDVFTYSFPCQDLSQSGKQKGLAKGTRSGLLWEIERILNNTEDLPTFLLMENVPPLFKQFKIDWMTWKYYLKTKGYITFDIILNATDFNSSQERLRAFSLSIQEDRFPKGFFDNFDLQDEIDETISYQEKRKDIKENGHKLIKDILQKNVDKKLFVTKEFNILKEFNSRFKKYSITDITSFRQRSIIFKNNSFCSTILRTGGILVEDLETNKPRNLSLEEYYLLFGFTKEDYQKTKDFVSYGEGVSQMGNSIVVNVLESLFEVIYRVNENKL